MYDADALALFMKAAVEFDRHGTLPVDTMMALQDHACCEACALEAVTTATQEAI